MDNVTAIAYSKMADSTKTIQSRFHDNWMPEPYSNCWLWIGRCNSKGYGKIHLNGKEQSAHRISWMLHRGNPIGTLVCHCCDTRSCVNPDHLFLGTHKDNLSDAAKKGRMARGERNFKAKLNTGQVLAIRSDFRSRSEIARSYGLSWTSVDHIKSRKNWRWL
jgi:hypothetical protein